MPLTYEQGEPAIKPTAFWSIDEALYFKPPNISSIKKHLKTTLRDWWSLTSTGWLPDVNKDETSVNIHANNIMVIALDYKTKTQLIAVGLVRGILRPTVKDIWILTFLLNYLFSTK